MTIRRLLEERELQVVIDREHPLDRIVDAHEYIDTGRKRGNVVIRVA